MGLTQLECMDAIHAHIKTIIDKLSKHHNIIFVPAPSYSHNVEINKAKHFTITTRINFIAIQYYNRTARSLRASYIKKTYLIADPRCFTKLKKDIKSVLNGGTI